MDLYNGVFLDLNIVAACVVIWVVTISIAFGIYIAYHRMGVPAVAGGPATGGEPIAAREEDVPASGPAAEAGASIAAEPAAAPSPESEAAEPSPYALSESRQTPDSFSVLIVDDNAINRQVLEMILDSVNIPHASVENGLEAVEAMSNCAYDAVLMDLQMPVMDGFEATRHIREMEQQADSPPATIIVVSANCLDEHVVAGREAGADAHLAKPISAGALIGELSACPAVNRIAA